MTTPVLVPADAPRSRASYTSRCLYVVASTDFKLKYAGSVLGYVWAIIRPLAYFGVLLLVFGRFFKGVVTPVPHFPLYLLIGIVLYSFFVEAVGATLSSLLARADLLRRLAFPRIIVPVSAMLTASITFGVNAIVIAVFIVATRLSPSFDWLLVVPLVLELLAFTLGFGLILASVYARLRDVLTVWELLAQLLIFAMPVMYPLSILPDWARTVALASPLVQVMQDLRNILIGIPDAETSAPWMRLVAITIALGFLVGGVIVFRSQERRLPERV